MSYTFLKADISFYQCFLKCAGFYTDKIDGKWGPNTTKADIAFMEATNQIRLDIGEFDPRTEANIITLLPKAQIAVRKFLSVTKALNLDVKILSGTRTYDEQNFLYRKGRRGIKGQKKVTNARGGQSNHNFGIAWDIGIFDKGTYITTNKPYIDIAKLIMPSLENLEWGGDWQSFKDVPHYQLKAISQDVSIIRANFEKGIAYV